MKVFGQDLIVLKNQFSALVLNLVSWVVSFLFSSSKASPKSCSTNCCVAIPVPGGLDKLEFRSLESPKKDGPQILATCGYNISGYSGPIVALDSLDNYPEYVVVEVHYFSINYADICVRWGLYESALRYVGWPIVPGFDFSGIVKIAGAKSGFKVGQEVFGFTMFGAYSCSLLVPSSQVRRVPSLPRSVFGLDKAAALPAVAATALHAVALAGGWPKGPLSLNKAALVHSAAGGVGCMLLQILRVQGYSPIVAVVGSSHKIAVCETNGATHVIVKSSQKGGSLWRQAESISPTGFAAIFDANGVETLQASYDHLARCGTLVTYGFHSNLPRSASLLAPWNWLSMIVSMAKMPKFDPMALVLESKTIAGFNLSFFSEETELIEKYMAQIVSWVEDRKIVVSNVTVFEMKHIGLAHQLIQSGNSTGKIVVKC